MTTPIRLVTLTGDLNQVSGQPAVGWVRIASYSTVRAPGADVVLVTQPMSVQLVDGRFSVQVPVSDQVTLEEQCLIEVQILLEDTAPDSMVLVVNTDQYVIDIADAVRLPIGSTDTTVPVVPWRSVGQPGGVAPLSPAGKVGEAYLPAASGGSVTWWEGDGPPPLVIPGAAVGDMYYDRLGRTLSQLQ
jgi:hypothetical protein